MCVVIKNGQEYALVPHTKNILVLHHHRRHHQHETERRIVLGNNDERKKVEYIMHQWERQEMDDRCWYKKW